MKDHGAASAFGVFRAAKCLARGRTILLKMTRFGVGILVAVAVMAVASAASDARGGRIVTHRASGAQSPCSPRETRTLVARFIVNFNDGDLRELNRLFSSPGLFKWFSVSGPSGRLNDASTNRTTLLAYFAKRHRKGERLALQSFQWKGYSLGLGQFLYSLTRRADDLGPTSYFGKGAVLCLHPRTISVWSMGPQ